MNLKIKNTIELYNSLVVLGQSSTSLWLTIAINKSVLSPIIDKLLKEREELFLTFVDKAENGSPIIEGGQYKFADEKTKALCNTKIKEWSEGIVDVDIRSATPQEQQSFITENHLANIIAPLINTIIHL